MRTAPAALLVAAAAAALALPGYAADSHTPLPAPAGLCQRRFPRLGSRRYSCAIPPRHHPLRAVSHQCFVQAALVPVRVFTWSACPLDRLPVPAMRQVSCSLHCCQLCLRNLYQFEGEIVTATWTSTLNPDRDGTTSDRGVIRRRLAHFSQKLSQSQRIAGSPGNSSFRSDPFEIPHQQQPKDQLFIAPAGSPEFRYVYQKVD